MTFPPGKEFFNLPAKFINQGDVFCRKIKAIGGYPIFYVINNIADQTQRLSGLFCSRLTKQYLGIVKNNTIGINFVLFQTGFMGIAFYAANKCFSSS